MTISDVTAVTTADLVGSVDLVCWGAAAHQTGATMHCHTQTAASGKTNRRDKYDRTKNLSEICFLAVKAHHRIANLRLRCNGFGAVETLSSLFGAARASNAAPLAIDWDCPLTR
jgi:hypothetical protein